MASHGATTAATLAEPLTPKQTVSPLIEEAQADVSGLIDTLANRVGEQHLYRFAPVASDVPERSVHRMDKDALVASLFLMDRPHVTAKGDPP
jgi:nucleotidyltransferase/DNA polymerase involved in DNA repair